MSIAIGFRFEADLAGAYGASVLLLDYEVQYALWLHLTRVRTQGAAIVMSGVQAAHSVAELPYSWWDGVAGLEECVDDMMAEGNLERAVRQVLRRGR